MGKVKDEIGKIYGYLTVIERGPNTKEGRATWICQCKCGNKVTVLGKNLRSGNTKSCGCYQKERAIESNIARTEDLTGKRFGRLTAIKPDGFVVGSNGKRRRLWLCQCDCGNQCHVQHQYLAYGDTNSCGCLSSVGNMLVTKFLTKYNINYKTEYSFSNFIFNTRPYRFDFALFDENKNLLGLIEYQGDIHYKYKKSGWNNEENFKQRQISDQNKKEYCELHNINLYYITYKDDIEEKVKEIINELYCK